LSVEIFVGPACVRTGWKHVAVLRQANHSGVVSTTKKSFRASRVLLVLLGVMAGGGLAWLLAIATPPPAPPAVRIVFMGRVQATGLAVFSISNSSPFAVMRSPDCRIQVPSGGGWTNQAPALVAPEGMLLFPGDQENISITTPAGLKTWRIDLDILRLGRPGLAGLFFNRMGGLIDRTKNTYSSNSDPIHE
jgi:hypothetical protein